MCPPFLKGKPFKSPAGQTKAAGPVTFPLPLFSTGPEQESKHNKKNTRDRTGEIPRQAPVDIKLFFKRCFLNLSYLFIQNHALIYAELSGPCQLIKNGGRNNRSINFNSGCVKSWWQPGIINLGQQEVSFSDSLARLASGHRSGWGLSIKKS